MNILISGGSGLVGRAIVPLLVERGHEVTILTTQKSLANSRSGVVSHVYWNPALRELDLGEVERADGVINLAGFSAANRWTQENKDRMVASRLDSTDLLVKSILKSQRPPQWMISASASGFYQSSDNWQDESAPAGTGFLAELTKNWEDMSSPLIPSQTRRIIVRIGIVLDPVEGALARMLPLFKAGLGAAVGSGKQWMSWIHLADLARVFDHLAHLPDCSGIYNASAPEPATNAEFSQRLAQAVNRKILLPPVPSFVLKMLYGEMASTVLASQRMNTQKLSQSGFRFLHPELKAALADILKPRI